MKQRINIGIDVDGVVTDFEKYIKEKGKGYFGIDVANQRGRDIAEMFQLPMEDEVKFWTENILDYVKNAPIREGFVAFLQSLRDMNMAWYVVTNRCNDLSNCGWTKDRMVYWTEALFAKIFQQAGPTLFEKIIFTTNASYPKVQAVKDNDIRYMIEDSCSKITELAEHIPVFKMKASYNEHLVGKNIIPVDSFMDIQGHLEQSQ